MNQLILFINGKDTTPAHRLFLQCMRISEVPAPMPLLSNTAIPATVIQSLANRDLGNPLSVCVSWCFLSLFLSVSLFSPPSFPLPPYLPPSLSHSLLPSLSLSSLFLPFFIFLLYLYFFACWIYFHAISFCFS